jgi:delta 1-pyrroline-5-carboxylate dehydrogenase
MVSKTNDAVAPQSIINPARHSDVVGYVQEATTEQVEQVLNNAQAFKTFGHVRLKTPVQVTYLRC